MITLTVVVLVSVGVLTGILLWKRRQYYRAPIVIARWPTGRMIGIIVTSWNKWDTENAFPKLLRESGNPELSLHGHHSTQEEACERVYSSPSEYLSDAKLGWYVPHGMRDMEVVTVVGNSREVILDTRLSRSDLFRLIKTTLQKGGTIRRIPKTGN